MPLLRCPALSRQVHRFRLSEALPVCGELPPCHSMSSVHQPTLPIVAGHTPAQAATGDPNYKPPWNYTKWLVGRDGQVRRGQLHQVTVGRDVGVGSGRQLCVP